MKSEMPEQPSPGSIDASSRAPELAHMLEAAKRQPGVAEVAAVYENWRQINVIRQAVVVALTPTPIVQAFENSVPSY